MSTMDASRETFSPLQGATGGSLRPRLSLLRAVEWVEVRIERRRSRLALLEMTDAQLQDIGVSRADAYRELDKPFWR